MTDPRPLGTNTLHTHYRESSARIAEQAARNVELDCENMGLREQLVRMDDRRRALRVALVHVDGEYESATAAEAIAKDDHAAKEMSE